MVHYLFMAPKQTDPQFKLRLSPELRDEIANAAIANSRSMNAEILARLESWQTLSDQVAISENAQIVRMWESVSKSQQVVSETIALNLYNLSRSVLDHAKEVPDQLAEAAKRHFDFSTAYLNKPREKSADADEARYGLKLFPNE